MAERKTKDTANIKVKSTLPADAQGGLNAIRIQEGPAC